MSASNQLRCPERNAPVGEGNLAEMTVSWIRRKEDRAYNIGLGLASQNLSARRTPAMAYCHRHVVDVYRSSVHKPRSELGMHCRQAGGRQKVAPAGPHPRTLIPEIGKSLLAEDQWLDNLASTWE